MMGVMERLERNGGDLERDERRVDYGVAIWVKEFG